MLGTRKNVTNMDLSDPVVLTGILTFITALLSALTVIILICCYFLRYSFIEFFKIFLVYFAIICSLYDKCRGVNYAVEGGSDTELHSRHTRRTHHTISPVDIT